MRKFPADQYEIFRYLSSCSDFTPVADIVTATGLDQTQVSAFSKIFGDQGLVEVSETRTREFSLRPAGSDAVASGFPERVVASAVHSNGGSVDIKELPQFSGLDPKAIGQSLRWLTGKGWGTKTGSTIKTEGPPPNEPGADEIFLGSMASSDVVTDSDLSASGIDPATVEKALELLKGRESWFVLKERTLRSLRLSKAGLELVSQGISPAEEIGQLTSEMLMSGSWRDAILRRYDVTLEAEKAVAGRIHPFMKIIDQTRKVFLEMGFDEVSSPYAESGFWDFDALFQPQDHPAREMQDTFFLSRPQRCSLPDPDLVARVRATHENGGDTGSVGWCYDWSEEKARQAVLRTHTTASTIRALASKPEGPRKVFCVGRVFRRETIDFKHLPVFFQVDGIIIDEKASFATLLGTLESFYRKMGFEKFQFRPAFFPYTEPSVEVFVWHEKKRDWIEMGGAGIFRPEVTVPLGCNCPVLAWGLGLERIAMFTYELNDIREIYLPDLKWLKEVPSCQ